MVLELEEYTLGPDQEPRSVTGYRTAGGIWRGSINTGSNMFTFGNIDWGPDTDIDVVSLNGPYVLYREICNLNEEAGSGIDTRYPKYRYYVITRTARLGFGISEKLWTNVSSDGSYIARLDIENCCSVVIRRPLTSDLKIRVPSQLTKGSTFLTLHCYPSGLALDGGSYFLRYSFKTKLWLKTSLTDSERLIYFDGQTAVSLDERRSMIWLRRPQAAPKEPKLLYYELISYGLRDGFSKMHSSCGVAMYTHLTESTLVLHLHSDEGIAV